MENELYEVIRKHKCYFCGNLLSVPPIMTCNVEKDMKLYKCGRCEKIGWEMFRWTRNNLFENVIQYLLLPCSFAPCKKIISWGKVRKHEKNCCYRAIKCPLSKLCKDYKEIRVNQFGKHIKNKHNQSITTDFTLVKRVDNMKNYIYFMQMDDVKDGLYFFVYILQGGIVAVLSTRHSKYTKFNVKLELCSNEDFATFFYNLPIVLYDDNFHCYMCLRNKCDKLHNIYFENYNGKTKISDFANKLDNELLRNLNNFSGKLRYYITPIPDVTIIQNPNELIEEAEDKILTLRIHCQTFPGEDPTEMDNKLYEVIAKYKCCICGHLLSIPPIMTSNLTDDNELYKCGRCNRVSLETYCWSRNNLYEEVARFLYFPCSFLPCSKRMFWERVEEHEERCDFRTVRCPLSKDCNCSEDILVNQFEKHFEDNHQKNANTIIDASSVFIRKGCMNAYLMKKFNQYFFVYIFGDGRIAVLAINRNKYTKFNLKLKLPSKDTFEGCFYNLPVDLYDVKLHCIMCITNECNENHYYSLENDKKKKINVDRFSSNLLNEISNSLISNETLRYTPLLDINIKYLSKICIRLNCNLFFILMFLYRYYITLIADEIITEDLDQRKKENDRKEDKIVSAFSVESITRALTCPYCMMYMATPIFMCTTGHTICNMCKSLYRTCPTCQASLDGPRNFSLENIADDLEPPCHFSYKGCNFVGTTSKIHTHEQYCSGANNF